MLGMSETKWADFVISAVKRGSTGRITHVQVHQDLGNSLSQPQIVDKMVVAHNIKKGKNTLLCLKLAMQNGNLVSMYVHLSMPVKHLFEVMTIK